MVEQRRGREVCGRELEGAGVNLGLRGRPLKRRLSGDENRNRPLTGFGELASNENKATQNVGLLKRGIHKRAKHSQQITNKAPSSSLAAAGSQEQLVASSCTPRGGDAVGKDREKKSHYHFSHKSLVSTMPSINCAWKSLRSLLLLSSQDHGGDALVYALYSAGVDLNARDEDGSTALMFASDAGEVDTILALIQCNVDIDTRDQLGRSAVTYAAYRGRHEALKILLSHGADVNIPDIDGCTPLMYSAAHGTLDCSVSMLQAGADLNAKNKDGFTALVYALECGQWSLGKVLIADGACPNSRSSNGSTCLHWAATCGQVESCELLLQSGVAVDAQNLRCITPLMYSTARGQIHTSKLLLSRGASVYAADSDGSTPLMYACYRGFTELAVIILEAGADLDAVNLRGATALMYAAARGQTETAYSVLKWAERKFAAAALSELTPFRRRILNVEDCKGFSAMDWAVRGGHTKTVEFLKHAMSGIPLSWTPENGVRYPDCFKLKAQAFLLSMGRLALPSSLADEILKHFAAEAVWGMVDGRTIES